MLPPQKTRRYRRRYARVLSAQNHSRQAVEIGRLPRISGKSKLAEALRYAMTRRDIFERFLSDGRIELDSNIVERAIRPQTITRKNSLFAGSDGGGCTWATIGTLLQTCKMNSADPVAWLTQTLERIANQWPRAEIHSLMPWNYKA
jgi:hypothetical protein